MLITLCASWSLKSHAEDYYGQGIKSLSTQDYVGCLENLVAYRESKRTELTTNISFSNSLDKNIEFCKDQLNTLVQIAKNPNTTNSVKTGSGLIGDIQTYTGILDSINASSSEAPKDPNKVLIEGNGISIRTDRATLVKGILSGEKLSTSGQFMLTPEHERLMNEAMNSQRNLFKTEEIMTVDPEIMNRLVLPKQK